MHEVNKSKVQRSKDGIWDATKKIVELSQSLDMNTITQKRKDLEMEFGIWPLHKNCRPVLTLGPNSGPNVLPAPNPGTGSLPIDMALTPKLK